MAKKKNDDITIAEEGKGNKLVSVLIVLAIVIIWIVILCVVSKLDVGGFGSKVLRPILKDVPVVNKILPAATDDEMASDNNIRTNHYQKQ